MRYISEEVIGDAVKIFVFNTNGQRQNMPGEKERERGGGGGRK